MDEKKEDLIDLWLEQRRKPGLGRNISYQVQLLNAFFSNPKQFLKKLGPFLFVDFIIVVTLMVILLLLLSPSR